MKNKIHQDSDSKTSATNASSGISIQAPSYGIEHLDQQAPENNTGIPDELKAGIENLSGYSMDDVKVHYNSSKPAQIDAHAYAQGTDIHLAPGQEGHLPHEAWHVVQQKQGRVQPTMQLKGKVKVNDDGGLEREADVMGNKALGIQNRTSKKLQNLKSIAPVNRVTQRVVYINNQPLPRKAAIPLEWKIDLKKNQIWESFKKHHSDRTMVFLFSNDTHLYKYLTTKKKEFEPEKKAINPKILERKHKQTQDERFSIVTKVSSKQIPSHASGAHQIPLEMFPPVGSGQRLGVSEEGGKQRLTIYTDLAPAKKPTTETDLLTYGNPNKPSLVMNRNGLNLGMHIQPTTAGSSDRHKLVRAQSEYGGGLPTVTNRVRGHPFTLHDSQQSTDKTSLFNFDNDPRTYTDESNSSSTRGGTSSFRYNKIELPSIKSGRPFTQVNINPEIGKMSIAKPTDIAIRSEVADKTYVDRKFDNTGNTDFRGAAQRDINKGIFKGGKQAHQDLAAIERAKREPFPETPSRKAGDEFSPEYRYTIQGYISPLPTPAYAYENFDEQTFTLNQQVQQHQQVEINSIKYLVTAITARTPSSTTFTATRILESTIDFDEYGTNLSKFFSRKSRSK